MRYKEFATSESIDRFMGSILGSPSASSTVNDIVDKVSGTKDTSNTPDKTQPDSSSTSDGEILPVNGPISSPFGRRSSGMHLGTDFAVPIGTPIKAPQDGVVSRTGSDNMNGTFVEINSGGVIHSLLHLSQSKVTSGQQVKKGQVVGLSGNTGYSTGPHLHWSKRVAGRPVDPMANIG
jgi:murein DD-endopeptidase MepM/ murein hydrolase activator NlpD